MKIAELRGQLDHLAGPGFLSPAQYIVISWIVLIAGVSTGNDLRDLQSLGLYAIANLLSLAITAIPFVAIRLVHRYTRIEFGFWHVVATGLILGASKSLSTGLIVSSIGLEPAQSALNSRLISGTLIGVAVVVLVSAVPLLTESYEKNRALLIRDAVARKLSNSMEPILASLKQELRAMTDPKLSAEEVAGQLEAVVKDKLRPLSKDLWDSVALRYPEFRLGSLAILGLKSTPIPTWPLLILYALGSPGLKQMLAGDLVGLLVILIQCCGIVVSIHLANVIKKGAMPLAGIVVAVLGISLSMNFLPDLFGLNIAGYNQLLGLGLVAVNSAFNITLVSTIAAGLKARRTQNTDMERVDRLQLDYESEELSRMLATRRAAEILHGQVQNRILGSAVRITGGNDYSKELHGLIGQLEDLQTLPEEVGLDTALNQLRLNWAGVIDIEWVVSGQPRALGFEVVEAIREAITNAYKHGLASKVQIRIEFQDQALEIEVLDDGLGPRNGKAGLGQRLLDSLGPWRISETAEGGTRLHFVIKD